jgi:anti-sigma B factor antagonist
VPSDKPDDLSVKPLTIEAAHGPEAVTLTLTGEIDLSSADKVADAIAEAKEAGQKVVIDLSEVEFIASTGLQALLRASSHDKQDGHRLSFVPSRHDAVKRLISLTETSEFFE